MTELEKKVLEVLKAGPLKMQEIAEACAVDKAALYHGALRVLLGEGKIVKEVVENTTVYTIPIARDKYKMRASRDDIISYTSLSLKEDINKERCLNTYTCEEYPESVEEIVLAAVNLPEPYIMSVEEGAKFFSTYAPVGWVNRDGFPLRNWKALLPLWQIHQSGKQLANARKEHERRSKGLPPIDPAEKDYEYYEDAQGRKWRRKINSDGEWEHIPELITFADGTTQQKGVL